MTSKPTRRAYVALQQNDEGNLRWGMYMPPYQVCDIARPGKAVAQIPDLSSLGGDGRASASWIAGISRRVRSRNCL